MSSTDYSDEDEVVIPNGNKKAANKRLSGEFDWPFLAGKILIGFLIDDD